MTAREAAVNNNNNILGSGLLSVLALALAVALLWPSASSLLVHWRQVQDYGHGHLIAMLSAGWLVLLAWRGSWPAARPSLAGGTALGAALVAWIVSVRGGIDIAHQLLWPLLLVLSVWAVAGPLAACKVAVPVGLLYFAVPVWDYAVPVLQRLSIFTSEHVLQLFGVPAVVSEYRVTIPAGTFEIIEGCSGKRYFMVALAVAYLVAAVNRIRGWRLPLFIAASAGIAMVTNWLRIVIVIYAGHATDMRHYLVAIEHETLGQVMFVALLVAVLWAGRVMASSPAVASAGTPNSQAENSEAPPWKQWRTRWHIAVLSLLFIAGAGQFALHRNMEGGGFRLGTLPVSTGHWQGPLPPLAGWMPRFHGADEFRRAAYVSSNGVVEIYANLYSIQNLGRELIHFGNSIQAPAPWDRPWTGIREKLSSKGGNMALEPMRSPDQGPWIVAFEYRVGSRSFRTDLGAKLAYGWYSLWGETPSGIIVLASDCDPENCDQARARVTRFWEDMRLPLRAMLTTGTAAIP